MKGFIENIKEIGCVHLQGFVKKLHTTPSQRLVNEVHTDFRGSGVDKTIEAVTDPKIPRLVVGDSKSTEEVNVPSLENKSTLQKITLFLPLLDFLQVPAWFMGL